MASLFRARRRRSPEEDGEDGDRSGSGRDKRRRLSPEEGALMPYEAAEEGRSPGWLSTFVSGAKRVISSVLFSSSEEQVSEEDDEEEEEEEEGCEADTDGIEDTTHEAVVPYSETKLAIQEMVMKETFSPDECDKMVKLLQSRVTNSTFPEAFQTGTPNEIPRRNAGAGHNFTGAWRSLSRNRDFPESGPSSSTGPSYFSPGGPSYFSPASPLEASPELCNAAVIEAKKWLEEKRQGLGTKPENHEPCILNTDMLNSTVEVDKGSPVDVAKSYMQSLPPWQSPLLGSRKFKTPPSSGVHTNVYERKSKQLLSAKVNTKEDFLSSANFRENLEELQRSRIKSPESFIEASKSRFHGSTSTLFDNDVSIFSPVTRVEVGGPVQSYKGSDKAAAAEPAHGCSLPIAPTKDGNHGAVDSVDTAPRDSDNLVQECHPASEVHPDEVPQGNHMPLTSAMNDVADHSGDVKSVPAEPEIHEELHMNSTSESRPTDTAPQMETESRPTDAAPQMEISLRALKKKVQTSLSGSTHKTSANGLVDRSDGNSGVESSVNDNPGCTNSSSVVPPSVNELINPTADAAVYATGVDNKGRTKELKKLFENGTGMDSPEPVKVAAPKPLRRGRKRAVRRD